MALTENKVVFVLTTFSEKRRCCHQSGGHWNTWKPTESRRLHSVVYMALSLSVNIGDIAKPLRSSIDTFTTLAVGRLQSWLPRSLIITYRRIQKLPFWRMCFWVVRL